MLSQKEKTAAYEKTTPVSSVVATKLATQRVCESFTVRARPIRMRSHLRSVSGLDIQGPVNGNLT